MTAASKRAFVVGWPISHSRSPLIHGHWIKKYNIDAKYEIAAVAPEDIGKFFDTIRAGEWCGGNVTIPHKHAALDLADSCDAAAQAIGAANTIVRDGRHLHARNTDAAGFIANLDALAPAWRNAAGPCVVLGAGGAASAIIWAILEAGVERVVLVNRTKSRADDLAARLGRGIQVIEWRQRHAALQGAGLLVNTTASGMTGMDPLDLDLDMLPQNATVCDIVYTPLVTPLLAAASARGNPTVDGLGMLLHQAVPGFAAWFGVTPEVTPALTELVIADIENR